MIKKVHPETAEILDNARMDYHAGNITNEQFNEIVLSCSRAEAEYEILGIYPEAQNEAGD